MAEQQEQSAGQPAGVSNPDIAVEGAATGQTEAEGGAAVATKTKHEPNPKDVGGFYWGTGRRKSAVARVRIRPGKGEIKINKREVNDFFHELKDQQAVLAPLKVTGAEGKFDVFVNVQGGGFTGQAGACLLGLARALVICDDGYEATLREHNFLTRDSRMKERKKYGQKGARKRFQFSKR